MSGPSAKPLPGPTSVQQPPPGEAESHAAAVILPDPWWLVVALSVVLLVAILIYFRRRSGPDLERFEEEHGVPVHATVPASTREVWVSRAGEAPLAVAEPRDAAVESMRSLRTALYLLRRDGAANRVVAITSSRSGEGRSFVAANLAAVLAETGARVLLLDADLRNGSLHRRFGLADGCGLGELLEGSVRIGSVISGTGVKGLDLIPAGNPSAEPSQLLGSGRFSRLLEHLVRYRYIVIDSASLEAPDDALPVLRRADVALMVVRGGAAPGIGRLREQGVDLHGVVFNRVRVSARRSRDGRDFGYA